MPEQIPLAEFQAKIRASSNGLAMSFQEAKKFAESIEYAIDCLMVAVKTKNIVDIYRLLADDFSFCEVVLRAIDSTDWMLGASDEAALQSLVLIAS